MICATLTYITLVNESDHKILDKEQITAYAAKYTTWSRMSTFKRLKPSNPKDSFQIEVALYNARTMRMKPYTKGIVLMFVIRS